MEKNTESNISSSNNNNKGIQDQRFQGIVMAEMITEECLQIELLCIMEFSEIVLINDRLIVEFGLLPRLIARAGFEPRTSVKLK